MRLMTHIDTDVKHCAAEFLFVLCKESGELQGLVVGFGGRESWTLASGQARERGMGDPLQPTGTSVFPWARYTG